jgi:DNA primase catalytic subunit
MSFSLVEDISSVVVTFTSLKHITMAPVDELIYATAKYIFNRVGKHVEIDPAWAAKITEKAIREVRDNANFCKGVTIAGSPCSRKAKAPTHYCFQHQGPRMVGDTPRHRSWEEKHGGADPVLEQDEITDAEVPEEEEDVQEDLPAKKAKKSKKQKKEKKEKKHRREEKPKKEKQEKRQKREKKE